MSDAQRGPLTSADLLAIWVGAVDRSYSAPLLRAGDGNGLEVIGQMTAQFARVSRAVDTTLQAMFIRPWSGQTSEPAGGERRATVTLTFARTGFSHWPIILGAGLVFFEEQTTDWGEDEGVVVRTGRRYSLQTDLVLEPGEQGPDDEVCVAERPGWGYNNPLPGTITFVDQPGSGFYHDNASVVVTNTPVAGANPTPPFTSVSIVAQNQPDMFVPEHVGQYVFFTGGANAGIVARVTGFLPPDASIDQGSTAVLDVVYSVEFATNEAYVAGEVLELRDGGLALFGYGEALDVQHPGAHTRVTFKLLNGSLPAAPVVVGQTSAVTQTVLAVLSQPAFTNETGAASWRVLDWAFDLGLTVTNELSPEGGRLGILDELGDERSVHRAPGEDDESYRDRIATIADVVTPNAIRRTLNKNLGTGLWCLRETGLPAFPGFFYDHDAWDYSFTRITGAVTGTFIDGEPVQQVVGGVIAYGVARTQFAAAVGPLPAAPGAETLQGFAMRGKTPFATGTPIVGLRSGASVTPATITQQLQNRDRYKVLLGYLEFRGYMFIGVRSIGTGEFGFAFDAGPFGAFDAAPYPDFFDGSPYIAGQSYLRAFSAIDKVRAGGVGYEFYLESGPCP